MQMKKTKLTKIKRKEMLSQFKSRIIDTNENPLHGQGSSVTK